MRTDPDKIISEEKTIIDEKIKELNEKIFQAETCINVLTYRLEDYKDIEKQEKKHLEMIKQYQEALEQVVKDNADMVKKLCVSMTGLVFVILVIASLIRIKFNL